METRNFLTQAVGFALAELNGLPVAEVARGIVLGPFARRLLTEGRVL